MSGTRSSQGKRTRYYDNATIGKGAHACPSAYKVSDRVTLGVLCIEYIIHVYRMVKRDHYMAPDIAACARLLQEGKVCTVTL